MPTNDEERDALTALLSAHPRFGKAWLTIRQCLKHRAIPAELKSRYIAIMDARYPTSNFDWYGPNYDAPRRLP